jgi:hypothetical protein
MGKKMKLSEKGSAIQLSKKRSAIQQVRSVFISRIARAFINSRIGRPIVVPLASRFCHKRTSAMMRVRNEEAFPRLFTSYRTDFWWCESPCTLWMSLSTFQKDCTYLHLKYCKPDPSERSSNFVVNIRPAIRPGPVVPIELRPLAITFACGVNVAA